MTPIALFLQFFQLYDHQSLVSHPSTYPNFHGVEQRATGTSLKNPTE